MKRHFTTAELTTIALLAALLCISSYITIALPVSPVPITAQTLIINLIALLLRPKRAVIPVLIWVLLGFAGLPVFTGGRSGFAALAGPTGGYIIGSFAAVILISLIAAGKNTFARNLAAVLCVGIPVIYLFGTPWMAAVTGMSLKAAAAAGILPFIPGDIAKGIAAVILARSLYRIVSQNTKKAAA